MNRHKWLFLGLACFLVLVVVRLIDLQLIRGEVYRQQVNDNRFFSIRIPPERGVFLDRYQQPLSWNERTYAQVDDPTAIQPAQTAIGRAEALDLLATASGSVRYGQARAYRWPEAMAHVLGYVGPVTADDLITDLSLHVSDVVGKTGLERVFDQQLRGQAGQEVYEINSLGERQRLVEQQPGLAGQNVITTLDPYLSQLGLQALGEQMGAVVILDGDTGQVLSLVSSPSYDANQLSKRQIDPQLENQRQDLISALFSDERQVFFNRAVSGTYPPGSVFKVITALGGLEGKAVDAATTVLDEGILRVGDFEYANWYFTQFGRTEGEISLQRALSRSNDIFFYKVAEWLGPNQLANYARAFGLGETTGIELVSEATGVVPDPAWKEKVIGEPWYLGNTFHMGIGQGDILVTPLQVAQLTQALINQGEMCRPSLLESSQANCTSLGLTEEHLNLVLSGMIDACSTGGTAYPFFQHNERQHQPELSPQQQIQNGVVACKTGTAEFGGLDDNGFRRTHGWLTAAFGTTDIRQLAADLDTTSESTASASLEKDENEAIELDYAEWASLINAQGFPDKLVITVLVESDEEEPYKEGSRDAGEVAASILNWMLGE